MISETHVSSTIASQLTIQSKHIAAAGDVIPSSLQINFSGSVKPIVITHDPSVSASRIKKLKIDDGDDIQKATASLQFKPNDIMTFEILQLLKKVETVSAVSVLFTFIQKSFVLKLAIDLDTAEPERAISRWFVEGMRFLKRVAYVCDLLTSW